MATVISKKLFRKECGKCCSTVEYSYDKVKEHKTNQDYLGGYDLVKGIKCPLCGKVLKHE